MDQPRYEYKKALIFKRLENHRPRKGPLLDYERMDRWGWKLFLGALAILEIVQLGFCVAYPGPGNVVLTIVFALFVSVAFTCMVALVLGGLASWGISPDKNAPGLVFLAFLARSFRVGDLPLQKQQAQEVAQWAQEHEVFRKCVVKWSLLLERSVGFCEYKALARAQWNLSCLESWWKFSQALQKKKQQERLERSQVEEVLNCNGLLDEVQALRQAQELEKATTATPPLPRSRL